jgi:phytoene dehydrogenase-like protein
MRQVSNASVWDTMKLLPSNLGPKEWLQMSESTPQIDSFLHLHLGIDAHDLPSDLECHHLIVNQWQTDLLKEPQNVCIASIPTGSAVQKALQ